VLLLLSNVNKVENVGGEELRMLQSKEMSTFLTQSVADQIGEFIQEHPFALGHMRLIWSHKTTGRDHHRHPSISFTIRERAERAPLILSPCPSVCPSVCVAHDNGRTGWPIHLILFLLEYSLSGLGTCVFWWPWGQRGRGHGVKCKVKSGFLHRNPFQTILNSFRRKKFFWPSDLWWPPEVTKGQCETFKCLWVKSLDGSEFFCFRAKKSRIKWFLG